MEGISISAPAGTSQFEAFKAMIELVLAGHRSRIEASPVRRIELRVVAEFRTDGTHRLVIQDGNLTVYMDRMVTIMLDGNGR